MSYMNHAIDTSPVIAGVAAAQMDAPAMTAVKFDENGKLATPGAGEACIGIVIATADSTPADGTLSVQIKDICYWIAGGEIKRGDKLKATAEGKAEKATDGEVLAIALDDAKQDKPCRVLICRMSAGGSSGGGSYAPVSHTHKAADITDGTSTFAEKVHTHTKSDITDLEG